MLSKFLKSYPTIEEIRNIVFRSLRYYISNNQMPLDLKFESEYIKGFEYSQFWISQTERVRIIAYISDIRKDDFEILLNSIGLSS